jgi:murein DD-endopeptidase
MPSFGVLARISFVLLIASALLTSGFARERGPRVEVTCPTPPIPVTLGKNKVLVYELHVTNFDTVPLALKRIEISASQETGRPLLTLEDTKLTAAMIRVGAAQPGGTAGASRDTRIVDPGGRNIVFVWIESPVNQPVPTILKHRMIFSSASAGAGNPSDTTLEDLQVAVSRESVPRLSPPFNGGIWLAGFGPANDSGHRRSIVAIDAHIYLPERFAVDWVKVGPNGDTHHDGTTKNENSWGWGEPVLAVADGKITQSVDEFPDNTPGILPPVTLDNIAGNRIILQIAQNRFVMYGHLQKGSIKVRGGEHVHRGDVLALLGNSGNSTGAHLHLQATNSDSALQTEGVPFVFADFIYLGPGPDYPEKQVSEPWANSIPPGNGVVKFEATKK